jgi:hypothetical protein
VKKEEARELIGTMRAIFKVLIEGREVTGLSIQQG